MTKILSRSQLIQSLSNQEQEYVLIQNPVGVFPAVEMSPLAKKIHETSELKAVVCDMDGTLTTTEGLCLHSLETMVRRWMEPEAGKAWSGLEPEQDYPHIIGNSTTRHVEYLWDTYGHLSDPDSFGKHFLQAAYWILEKGQDPVLMEEVHRQLVLIDLNKETLAATLKSSKCIHLPEDSIRVSFAVTIYYQRYHEILAAIGTSQMSAVAPDLNTLIEPMPGVALFLTLIKGLLTPTESLALWPVWEQNLPSQIDTVLQDQELKQAQENLRSLTERFSKAPLKVALVTSSIDYEMRIVLREVFKALQAEISGWPLHSERISELKQMFQDHTDILDIEINASHSNEGRLKPHRDLYSMALQRLNINPEQFQHVIGFEDSESGTIAIRAAGVGLAIAVPFQDTSQHDLSAAAHVQPGGLAQAVLLNHLFIKHKG